MSQYEDKFLIYLQQIELHLSKIAGALDLVPPRDHPVTSPADPDSKVETDPDAIAYHIEYPAVGQTARRLRLKGGAWEHYSRWGKDQGFKWPGIDDEPDIEPDTPKNSVARHHHVNTRAWHGKGSAVVLCNGDAATSVKMNGNPWQLHGSLDKSRQVWTDYNSPGLTGTLEITIDGVTYTSQVTNPNGMTPGRCG